MVGLPSAAVENIAGCKLLVVLVVVAVVNHTEPYLAVVRDNLVVAFMVVHIMAVVGIPLVADRKLVAVGSLVVALAVSIPFVAASLAITFPCRPSLAATCPSLVATYPSLVVACPSLAATCPS